MTDTTTTPTGHAVEKRQNGGEAMIEQYKGSFAMVLPSHVKPDMFIRLSQGLLRRDATLAAVANRNPGSFLSALLDCARLGLEPGDTYHLVAFGNEVTGIVDYKGEVELIYRAGEVHSIKAEVVHEHDEFVWDPGEMDRPIHKADWFADRGKMIGAYAYGVMRSGAISRVILMGEAEIMAHKAMSRGSDRATSPWNKWPRSMWLKTVTHELKKWVPSSAEYREQVIRQELAGGEAAEQMGVTLPGHNFDAPDLPESNHDDDIVDAEVIDFPADANGEPTEPEPSVPAVPDDPMTDAQSKAVHALLRSKLEATGPSRFPHLSRILGREITSTKEISKDEAGVVIEHLQDLGGGGDEAA